MFDAEPTVRNSGPYGIENFSSLKSESALSNPPAPLPDLGDASTVLLGPNGGDPMSIEAPVWAGFEGVEDSSGDPLPGSTIAPDDEVVSSSGGFVGSAIADRGLDPAGLKSEARQDVRRRAHGPQ